MNDDLKKPDREQAQTSFASPERSSGKELQSEILQTGAHPLIDALLATAGGLLAVLNEHRQVLTLNTALLETFGIDDPEGALGLRLGEMAGCVHAKDNPAGGCGTGEQCASCGAAIAIVASQQTGQPHKRNCCMRYRKDGVERDLYLEVQAHPLKLDERNLVLVYLADISEQQMWTVLERVFFHDLNNIITVLSGNAELLSESAPPQLQPLVQDIFHSARRLEREVALQRMLFGIKTDSARLTLENTPLSAVFDELLNLAEHHPAGKKKRLSVDPVDGESFLMTDMTALLRVLGNMLVNALEAIGEGEEVRLWCERTADRLVFCVSNPGQIPPEVAGRIFQRNFSTKADMGRGLGTYSMKLFGEDLLGGKVSFACTEDGQVQFSFSLPA